MEEFELMQAVAERIKKALSHGVLYDGRDKYDLSIDYEPEARVAMISEDAVTIKVELNAESTRGFRHRTLTIAVTEEP